MPRLVFVTLALGLCAGLAGAHEIDAPGAVQAGGAGHFAYDIIVTITAPIEYGGSRLDGTDNTDLWAWVEDGWCVDMVEPGDYTIPIEGNLVDIGSDGSVYYEHGMCDGWTDNVTTVILAPTVGTEERSWSAVKGLYRQVK